MTDKIKAMVSDKTKEDENSEAKELEASIESLYDMAMRYRHTKRPPQIQTGVDEIDWKEW